MRRTVRSKLLAGTLSGAMAVTTCFAGYVPAYADTVSNGGTVYISISDDAQYVYSDTAEHNEEVMAYIPVSIDAIAQEIDLDERGYTDFLYDADDDGEFETTLFQGFLYTLEHYYSGGTEDLVVTGSAGSTYLQNGFWGHDENLTYYVNGQYPLESPAWGATSDHIVLHDGDFIDVSMYSDWDFWTDPNAGYHYFADTAGQPTHEYHATAGQALTVSYTKANTDWNATYNTIYVPCDSEIFYGTEVYGEDFDSVNTEDGSAEITFPAAGTYYLWADGQEGASGSIVSAPAYAKVIVEAAPVDPEDPEDPEEPDVPVVTAEVAIRSQMAGMYLTAINETTEVSSDLAESYGFTDQTPGQVSALDALVAAHLMVFGEDFTEETAADYLAVSAASGFVSKLFGEETMSNGFLINGGYPNDGTESSFGGYNGTTVTTQAVADGDVIDFFTYGDTSYWSDYYTFTEVPESVEADAAFNATVSGTMVMMGYEYADPAEFEAAAEALEDAALCWVDTTSGEVFPIMNEDDELILTDEDGIAEITAPSEPGLYYLSAMTNEEEEVYCLLNPAEIEVTEAPEPVTLEASITINTPSDSAALYAKEDEEKENNLLAAIEKEGNTYKVNVEAGEYILEAFTGDISNGTIVLKIDEENQAFTVFTVTAYCTTSGFAYGTDYTIENLQVLSGGDKATVLREVTMGDSSTAGRKTFLVLNGDTYSFYGTPAGEKAATYVPTYKTGTVTATNYTTASFTMAAKSGLTVIVPYADTDADGENDYILEVGQMTNYYIYTYLDPQADTVDEAAGTEAQTFETAKSGAYFYRVTNPLNEDAVTYGNYITCSAESNTATVTTADMKVGDSSLDSKTVIKGFAQNTYDTGDIYMNINEKGHLNLASGSSYNLYPFRNWLAIESISNAKVIEPVFHVEVVDVDGSGAITVTEKTENNAAKHSYEIKANHTGTAIVKVTYDAMYDAIGMGSKPVFSANWPENTGIFVVTVDGATGINTGMTINEGLNTTKVSGDAYDADLDVLYYTGDAGASYTFTPEAGTQVTMSVGQLTANSMNFGAFTSDGVTVNGDGSVTLSGLTTGKTIVKLTNGGRTEYQVLKAMKLSYTVTNAAGEIVATDAGQAEDAAIRAGDSLTFKFDTVYIPANKLSGIYNMSGSIRLTGEDGTVFSGTANQYLFASTPAAQTVTVKIPKYWPGLTYNLTGLVYESGFGSPYGSHRMLTYEAGKAPNFTAVSCAGSFGSLPDIALSLEETAYVNGSIVLKDQDGNAVDLAKASISLKDNEGNAVVINADGSFNTLEGTYDYVVNAAGYMYNYGKITVDASASTVYEIVLTESSENAWDGTSKSQPAQDEDGTYLIGTGAELAWFQNEVTTVKNNTINAKLTVDIDLASYPWTPIGSTSSQLKGIFDGDGHAINNLYCKGTGTLALIGCLYGTVKDLTVNGTVEGTSSNLAGIVAYAQGQNAANPCHISNVVNNVDVIQNNASASSASIGGIAGYTYFAVIENCTNNGTITTNSTSTTASGYGGIVGYMMNYAASITGCKNTGSVTGRKNVGGILGYAGGNKVTLNTCYNTGDISGAAYVGGIVGDLQGAAFAHGYNTGAFTPAVEGAVFEPIANDSKSGNNVTDAWYLDSFTGTAANGTALAMADLKSRDIQGFGMTCDSTPALLWEDAQFHQKNEGVVTAPTCTEEGYTTYICPVCNKEYKGDPVPANGHTPVISDQHVGYGIGTCSVCGIDLTVWDDDRLQALTYDEKAVSAISMTDNGSYPWIANGTTLTSGNKGVDSSTSATTIFFTLCDDATVSFNYAVSSEARYDKLTIRTMAEGVSETIADDISGTEEGTFSRTLTPGSYSVTLSFAKDSSSASGRDLGEISNFTIAGLGEFGILQQPESIETAKAGDTITYTVVANRAASYQWQFSKNGTKWYNSALPTADTASITMTAADNNIPNKYRCIITGRNGEEAITDVVEILNVTEMFLITEQPQNWDAADGTAATFAVTATGAESFQWYYSKDGQKWYKSSAEAVTENGTSTLSVTLNASSAANLYRCKVTGNDGTTKTSAIASFTGYPVITEQPQSVDYAEGNQATFTVTVAEPENCTYQWYYSKDGEKWYKSGAEGSTAATISLTMNSKTEANNYRCKITENGFTVTSDAVGFAN